MVNRFFVKWQPRLQSQSRNRSGLKVFGSGPRRKVGSTSCEKKGQEQPALQHCYVIFLYFCLDFILVILLIRLQCWDIVTRDISVFSNWKVTTFSTFLHSLSITSLFSLSLVCEPEVSGQPGSEKKRRQTGGRTGPSQCALLLQSSSLGGEEKVLLTALVPSNLLSFYCKMYIFHFRKKKNTRQHCSKKCSKTRKARGLNRWPFSNNLW